MGSPPRGAPGSCAALPSGSRAAPPRSRTAPPQRIDARAVRMGDVQLPRFWIAMQVVIVVCVLISAVIVIVKL